MANKTKTEPHIVVIGGGTGSFTILQEVKKLSPNITALVSMSDDGGSTGVLRDELGVLPPGDVRQCLVALSGATDEMRDLFNFRFGEGTFEGHSFGNIFLSAVEKMTDNFNDAVRIASDVLRITGRVVPITLDNHQLALKLGDQKIIGEFAIGTMTLHQKPALSLTPKTVINPVAKQAIADADLIIIAPGNLYASLAPSLLVSGVSEALQNAKAKVVYICNLVNKAHQTPDFAVHDFADEIERFAGKGVLDYVLYNTDIPSDRLLHDYALEGEFPVLIDADKLEKSSYQGLPGSFLSRQKQTRNKNDTRILRSLIRHDAHAVAKAVSTLI